MATALGNLAQLLQNTGRATEAEPLMRRALDIDEASFAPDHPTVAISLNNYALLLLYEGRFAEAQPLMRRGLNILIDFSRRTGHRHPNLQTGLRNYTVLLQKLGKSGAEIDAEIKALASPLKP